jgi:hypothetical protein
MENIYNDIQHDDIIIKKYSPRKYRRRKAVTPTTRIQTGAVIQYGL